MMEMKKNLLVTICGRAGSKGVKSKNTRIFNGYPLVYYALSAYQGFVSRYGSEYGEIALAVNTDSPVLIEQCSRTLPEIHYINRKESLGGDTVAKADVICDTLEQMEEKKGCRYEAVVDLDLTSPLRTAQDIDGCIKALFSHPQAGVAYSVTGARRLPYFNMVRENEEGYLEMVIPTNYTARQEAPACYDMNGSIYAYRREPLLHTAEENIFLGKTVGWMMKDTAVLDIDNEEDLELLSVLAEYFYQKYEEYGVIRKGIPDILKEKEA